MLQEMHHGIEVGRMNQDINRPFPILVKTPLILNWREHTGIKVVAYTVYPVAVAVFVASARSFPFFVPIFAVKIDKGVVHQFIVGPCDEDKTDETLLSSPRFIILSSHISVLI